MSTDTSPAQQHPHLPEPRASQDEPINILIVDDEPKNLTVLETLLDDPGYRLSAPAPPSRLFSHSSWRNLPCSSSTSACQA